MASQTSQKTSFQIVNIAFLILYFLKNTSFAMNITRCQTEDDYELRTKK